MTLCIHFCVLAFILKMFLASPMTVPRDWNMLLACKR